MQKQDLSHVSTFEELLEISKANGYDRNWAPRKAKALGIVNPRSKKKSNVHIIKNESHKLNNEPPEKEDNHSKLGSLQAQVERLKTENIQLKQELENYKTMSTVVHKIKNERGAGRKPKLNDELIAKVKSLKSEGLSYKAIAQELSISVGLAHKASQL